MIIMEDSVKFSSGVIQYKPKAAQQSQDVATEQYRPYPHVLFKKDDFLSDLRFNSFLRCGQLLNSVYCGAIRLLHADLLNAVVDAVVNMTSEISSAGMTKVPMITLTTGHLFLLRT